jgi:hypothetical protein
MAEQPDKVVQITLDQTGLPVPDQDPVPVKKDHQKVRWSADFDFRITIDGYNEVNYSNAPGKYECKTGYFTRESSYKYTISANGKDNDPTLDVKP